MIIGIITDYFSITRKQITSRSRERTICEPRQICTLELTKYTNLSLKTIGKLFNRDHATVINAKKTINNLVEVNGYGYVINELDRLIEEKLMMNDEERYLMKKILPPYYVRLFTDEPVKLCDRY